MKKTLIASTIAATLATNAMAMEEAADIAAKIDAMPTVYGSIELVHVNTDEDGSTAHDFQDNGSTIGITHEHMISEDLTAFAKAEFEFAADEDNGEGINTLDEAYIGVKGDFGSVQVGSDETVYDWVRMLDTSEHVGIGYQVELTEGDNLQYVSPELAEGLHLGLTAPIDSDNTFGGALAAKYAMDNIEVALAYAMGREEGTDEAEDTIGLAASISLDELTLMAQYETTTDTADVIGLQAMYTMGQNTFALGYQMTSFDASGSDDQSDIYIQALHNLSDNAYIYLEYLMQSDAPNEAETAQVDLDTLAIGATYLF